MKLLNSLIIITLLLIGCSKVDSTRIVPGLALATVLEKGIDSIDGKFILKLECTDHDLLFERFMGNLFINKVHLHSYTSEAIYNSVDINEKVVLAYQTVTEENITKQRVWIIWKKDVDVKQSR